MKDIDKGRRRALALAGAWAGTSALPAFAQAPTGAYPNHAMKLAVGFAPGTGPDVITRTLGNKLGELMGQSMVIENRAGAGGQIAASYVAKSAPDGYTLLIADLSAISIAPAAFSKLPYDPAKELDPVAEAVVIDFVLVVPPNAPYTNLAEFVAACKARKDKVNFATFGAGTPGHFGAELFAEQGGFKAEPIHFRATGDAVTAIVSGEVQAAFVSTALAMSYVKTGKMKGLATTSQSRIPQLPEIPTFKEQGFPKADFSSWFCLFVPKGTPPAIMEQLGKQSKIALAAPEVKKALEDAGFRIVASTQDEARRMVAAEAVRWKAAVVATGFKGD